MEDGGDDTDTQTPVLNRIWVEDGSPSCDKNAKKTVAMCFGTSQTLNKVGQITIKHKDTTINMTKELKYLGVILDPTLTFENRVNYIKKKCNGRLRMLSKLRQIVGPNTTLTLYKSLIAPVLD